MVRSLTRSLLVYRDAQAREADPARRARWGVVVATVEEHLELALAGAARGVS